MNSKKIYDNFLELKEIKGNNEKFDFAFNTSKSKKEFEQEYIKFISLYNYFFFDTQNKAIVTIFNSYPCTLDDKTIKHLKVLYEKSKEINNIYTQLIAEFIFSYKKSLETKKYKRELAQNELRKYKGILYKTFPRNYFELKGELFRYTIKFYTNIINYVIKHNLSIEINQKIRILTKFRENERNEKQYKKIFDYILSENESLNELIKYDYNISSHLIQYKSNTLNNAANSNYLSEQSLEIFEELLKNLDNQDDFIKEFINKYIILCNELTKQIMLKEDNSILAISRFEQIIKELNKIKRTNISDKFKDKINECICKILCIKRKILSDTEYVNSYLHEHEFKFEIPHNQINNMHNDILNNFAKIYPYVKIDFNEMIPQSIKSYAKHPMLYLVTNITIGNNELYAINEPQDYINTFKSYYDAKGKEYSIKNAKKLRNILEKDYYENMLKYTQTEFNFKIGLIASIIYKDIEKIKYNIDLARLDGNEKNSNLYIEMVKQIIGIEVNIYKLLKINNILPKESIEENLALLFKKYNKNDFYQNAIMNIYYFLYCKRGYHLRNDIMHGDLLSKNDYTKELIMIYACMIAINFMVSNANNKIE